jgi:trans-AT polyketide synthase/acyltransferase/oxidoreductase domain-containing protein
MKAVFFPGQGSQRRGMGSELFPRFPAECELADDILGYSIRDLCLNDAGSRLKLTQFVQPALFVVNALTWFARKAEGVEPAYIAGHSLGEYNALLAAECMDFAAGLRMVKRRGELMGMANGGGMVAVIGLTIDRVTEILNTAGVDDVDIANHNAQSQIVLAGLPAGLERASAILEKERAVRMVPLKMSAAAHSRYMEPAAQSFFGHLKDVAFQAPRFTVLANVTAAPIKSAGEIPDLLRRQIVSRVRWWEIMKRLRAAGVRDMEELGPGHVLADLWSTTGEPTSQALPEQLSERPVKPRTTAPLASGTRRVATPEALGSAEFRNQHGVRLAYVAGAMFRAIASTDLVIRMGKAGLLSFYGAGGMTLEELEQAIRSIKAALPADAPWGMNLLHAYGDPTRELETVALYLRHDVQVVEAAAFFQATPALVLYRFKGACYTALRRPVAPHRVIAKVSRPEVALAFLQPAPESIVRALVADGRLTATEGEIARQLPISEDLCVEADSGGHTDARQMNTLLPAIARLRDEVMNQQRYGAQIRMGAAGGIGTPEAVASAFMLGADFVLAGSVHQCSPEAGTSDTVKEMLAGLDVQDTAYAPAGDMFEVGARVQVVRKGTLFPGRANKLQELYRLHGSLSALDARTRESIEQFCFRRSLDEVWQDTASYFSRIGRPQELEKAERDPKHKMALVFRAYFSESLRAALDGDQREKANFQIHCGPAMGAFNAFAKGGSLEPWRERHVDIVAWELMCQAASRVESFLQKHPVASVAAHALAT